MVQQHGEQARVDLHHVADVTKIDGVANTGLSVEDLFWRPFFGMHRELPTPFDPAPHYRVTVSDRIWTYAYVPLATLVQRVAQAVTWLQQGRIATYLTYSFVTLLVLLALVL